MQHFRIRALAYGAIILLGLIAALPSLLPSSVTDQFPPTYAGHKITLGLDLRGGSHLLLEVDTDTLQSERLLKLGEELVQRLRDAGVDSSRAVASANGPSHFRLNASGASRFADITRAHVGTPFAVVLDGKVVTAPVIRSPITGGSGEISGSFTVAQARDLALLLRAGSLPAPLAVVEERTVGPDLGSDSIRMGITTGLVGAALVLGFMVTVYGRWGWIANTALLINAGLIVGVLATFGATLTLPGIAGLILTIGMAVDANILINERIREESRKGASARYALHLGFQRAFSTILDSNITTLIAVGLLFLFGTGPVRGFAVAIAVGLVVSMFTSISVTRLLMEWRVSRLAGKPLQLDRVGWLDRAEEAAPWLR